MLKNGLVLFAALFLLTAHAFAQDESRFDIGFNGAGLLSKSTQGNQVTQSPTQSVGVLLNFRLRVAPRGYLSLNYGRAKNSQKYAAPPFDYRIPDDVTEITGTYMQRLGGGEKLKPFVLGGAGALVFGPTDTFINGVSTPAGAVRQARFAIVYGAGADYHLLSRLSLRVQYRGLIYQPPNFKVANLFTGGHGHIAEPSVGIVFRLW